MSRYQLAWGAGAAVVLSAVSGALINELHQGWPWWIAAIIVTGTGAVLAGRLAAGSPDDHPREPDTATGGPGPVAGPTITVDTVHGAVGEFHAPVSFDQRAATPPVVE